MDLSKISVFAALTARMRWLTERQSVIASNVANADTPNYRARDLKPLNFRDVLRQSQVSMKTAQTNAAHIGSSRDAREFAAFIDHRNTEVTPTGNAVVIENEMLKVAQTVAEYQLMTNLYRKNVSLLKLALGRGK
jgi:flagellar basal-body rod protein FlgB